MRASIVDGNETLGPIQPYAMLAPICQSVNFCTIIWVLYQEQGNFSSLDAVNKRDKEVMKSNSILV